MNQDFLVWIEKLYIFVSSYSSRDNFAQPVIVWSIVAWIYHLLTMFCDNAPDVQRDEGVIYAAFSRLVFRDGTTDVTRTYHFGTPSAFERKSFTMVLKVTNFTTI